MAEIISVAIARCHLRTMERLGVEYDVLPRESEILHLKFWDAAFHATEAARRDSPGRRRARMRAAG